MENSSRRKSDTRREESTRRHDRARTEWKKVKVNMLKKKNGKKDEAAGAKGNWFANTFKKIFNEGKFDFDPSAFTPLLMEIVSARNLSKKNDIDPYVVVHQSGKEVHRTKNIPKDKDPIWTVMTGSLCIVNIPNKCVDENEDQTLNVAVWSGLINQIGSVTIPFEDLLKKTGEREEYPITGKDGKNKLKCTIALRFRPAKESDFEFFYQNEDVKPGAVAEDINFHNVTQPSPNTPLFKLKMIDGVEHVRVQPGPDPDRPEEETRWMTLENVHKEALKPSTRWVEAGYGSLGKCYVEIIGCDDLPNMDLGAANDFTDAFVGVVFEDTMVRTNVMHDNLSPRWMPWTTRAFAFNIRHPASLLFIGVFDYDLLTEHDPIGRVVIETERFESDTSYLLHYNMYQDMQQKEAAGTITIRLRVEWKSEAEAVKMAFVSPPRFLINVESKKALDVLRYLCRGPVNMQVASIESVSLYAEELMSYGDIYFYIIDVICGILLWRGRANIGFGKAKINIWCPIHSIFIFLMANFAVEMPRYLVPIVSFSITWFLASRNFYGSNHPSPWRRCKSVNELNKVMIVGHSCHGPIHIQPNEFKAEAKLRDELDQVKADRMKGLFFEALYTGLKIRRVYNKTNMEKIEISTEDKAKGWNFLTNYLYYIHLLLYYLCTYLNMLRNMINWRGYFAHQLTLYSFSLTVAWFILPMEFLTRWVLRIFVWTLLGPGMKLVDIFLFHPYYNTREELETDPSHDGWQLEKLLESEALEKMGEAARLAAEEALKLKDMRTYRFGELSQLIPAADASRFPCVPLPSSSAEPYLGMAGEGEGFVDVPDLKKLWRYVPGQRLEGHMIHRHVKTVNAAIESASERDDVRNF